VPIAISTFDLVRMGTPSNEVPDRFAQATPDAQTRLYSGAVHGWWRGTAA
jgi:hypothetical protein